MNYSIEDLERDIEVVILELKQMREDKGHDYSGKSPDTLANLRDFGSLGVLVRIGDKFHRLKSFYEQGRLAVKDESVGDTMRDLINYSLYLLIMRRQEQVEQPEQRGRTERVFIDKFNGEQK